MPFRPAFTGRTPATAFAARGGAFTFAVVRTVVRVAATRGVLAERAGCGRDAFAVPVTRFATAIGLRAGAAAAFATTFRATFDVGAFAGTFATAFFTTAFFATAFFATAGLATFAGDAALEADLAAGSVPDLPTPFATTARFALGATTFAAGFVTTGFPAGFATAPAGVAPFTAPLATGADVATAAFSGAREGAFVGAVERGVPAARRGAREGDFCGAFTRAPDVESVAARPSRGPEE